MYFPEKWGEIKDLGVKASNNLSDSIARAKELLNACEIDLVEAGTWKTVNLALDVPYGDPTAYSDEIRKLGETVAGGTDAIPLILVDRIHGPQSEDLGDDYDYQGRTFSNIYDQTYEGPAMFMVGDEMDDGSNTVAHELWHIAGKDFHAPEEDASLASATGDATPCEYCDAVRGIATEAGD